MNVGSFRFTNVDRFSILIAGAHLVFCFTEQKFEEFDPISESTVKRNKSHYRGSPFPMKLMRLITS